MTYKGFEITTACANNVSHDDGSAPIYGDIYDDYNEYLSDHPDDEVIFGFFINVYDAPDWFYTINDAMEWVDKYIEMQERYRGMTTEDYESLFSAREVICHYCQAEECEKCIVTRLIDDAQVEYEELMEEE